MTNWVDIDAGRAIEALCWVKDNCPSYITNDYHKGPEIRFYFDANRQGQKEMLMFQLKWA